MILRMADGPVSMPQEFSMRMGSISANQPVELQVSRDGRILVLQVTPDNQGKIGVVLAANAKTIYRQGTNPGELLMASVEGYGRIAAMTFESLGMLAREKRVSKIWPDRSGSWL